MEQFISLPEAREILAPRLPAFANALGIAVRTWATGLSQYHRVLDESARAIIINQIWNTTVRSLLYDDTGVKFLKVSGQRFLYIDERISLRFKLVDTLYLSKNYPTSRALAWNRQLTLPGIPRAGRVELGYIPDLTGTDIKCACVLLRVDDTVVWLWQIWGVRDDTFGQYVRQDGTDMLGRVVFAYEDYSNLA